jgi:glycerol-3-phosphate acyltransferase PlsX
MRIAVDGMGGDNAPEEIVKGCVEASKVIDDEIYILGIEEVIKKELKKYKFDYNKVKIVNASEVITNDDAPVKAARSKKDSSMIKGLSLVKEGTCDLMISGGNTGALMAGALFRFGRIKGIERPAIGMTYPIIGEGVSLLVDAGANSECRPSNLHEFAVMGSIYMNKVLGVENPSVGLINIGAEEKKGTPVLKEAYQLLKDSEVNFCGNVEAREIPFGAADVLVCDGFVGNTILKLSEGLAEKIVSILKDILGSSFRAKMGAVMMADQLKDIKKMFDYSEYGGAPILGVRGPVIKIHGSSNANAVRNAIIKGIPYVEKDVVGIISENFENGQEVHGENE